MTEAAAKALEKFSDGEAKVDNNYSGRFMYGATTCGIIIPAMSVFYSALANIMDDGNREEKDEVAEFLREGIQHDDFGRGFIIY